MLVNCLNQIGYLIKAASILMLIVGTLSAQNTNSPSENQSALEFRRILVTSGDEENWSQEDFGTGLWIPLAEFEQMLNQLKTANDKSPKAIPLQSTNYQAEFEQGLLIGSMSFSPTLEYLNKSLLPLGTTNLNFSQTADQSEESPIVGSLQDKSNSLLAIFLSSSASEDQQEHQLSWSLQCTKKNASVWHAKLQFPLAETTVFDLALPASSSIKTLQGILLSSSDSLDSSQKNYQLAPQGDGILEFEIVEKLEDEEHSIISVHETSDYQLNASELQLNCVFEVTGNLLTSPEIQFTTDPELAISQIDVNGAKADFQFAQDPITRHGKVSLPLSTVSDGAGLTIEVRGVCPIQYSDAGHLSLPRVKVSDQIWEQGQIELVISDHWQFHRVASNQVEVTEILPDRETQGTRIRLNLLDSHSPIPLLIKPLETSKQVLLGTTITLSENKAEAQVDAKLSTSKGEAFSFELQLGKNWLIEEVLLNERDDLFDWEQVQKRKRNYLILRFKKPVSRFNQPVLKLSLSQPYSFTPGLISLNALTPIIAIDAKVTDSWFALNSISPLSLLTDPDSFTQIVSPSSIPNAVATLLQVGPDSHVIQGHRSLAEDYQFRARLRNNSISEISSQLQLASDSSNQQISIKIDQLDDTIKYIDLQTNKQLPASLKWKLNDLFFIKASLLTEAELTGSGYSTESNIYRVEIPLKVTSPIDISAEIIGNSLIDDDPLLISVPNSSSQVCTIDILRPQTISVESNERSIRRIYSDLTSQSTNSLEQLVDRFSYNPIRVFQTNQDQKTLFSISQNNNSDIPALYIPNVTHQLSIFEDGLTSIKTDFELVVNHQMDAFKVSIPEKSKLLFVQLNGHPINAEQLENQVLCSLPEGISSGLISVDYQEHFETGQLSIAITPEYATVDYPIGTTKFHIHELPSQLVMLPRYDNFNLAGHLGKMILGDRIKIESSLTLNSEAEIISKLSNAEKIVLWNQQQIKSIGYGLFLLSLLATVALKQQKAIAFASFFVLLISISSFSSVLFYPISSNIFQGTILGLIYAYVWNHQWVFFARDDTNPRVDKSTIQKSTALLFAFFLLFAPSNLIAQEQETSQANRTVYSVLVPVDEEEKPVGEIYLTTDFHKLLLEAISQLSSSQENWKLLSSQYSYEVTNSNNAAETAQILTAITYILETEEAEQIISIPLPELNQKIITILADDALVPLQWNNETNSLDIPFQQAGRHTLVLTSEPLDVNLIEAGDFKLTIPSCPDTRVELVTEGVSNRFHIESSQGEYDLAENNQVSLGATNEINLRWNAEEQTTEIEYDHFDLLSISRGEVFLESKFQIKNLGDPLPTLTLQLDSRLQPLTTLTNLGRIRTGETKQGQTTIYLDLTEPLTEELEFSLKFRLSSYSGIGQLRYPKAVLDFASRRQHFMGITVPFDFTLRTSLSDQDVIMQETFAQAWGKAIPDFREAYSLNINNEDTIHISSFPNPPQATVESEQQLTLHSDAIKIEFTADISISQGSFTQFLLSVGPEIIVDDVYVSENEIAQSVHWSQNLSAGEVAVHLLQPVVDQQKLTLVGHSKPNWDETFQYIPISLAQMTSLDSTLTINRDESISINEIMLQSMVEIAQEEASPTIASERFSVGYYEVSPENIEAKPQISINAEENIVLLSGELRTTVGRLNESWAARVDCELTQQSGRWDFLDFYIPQNLTFDPSSLQNYQAIELTTPIEEGSIWRLYPLQSVGSKFRISFTTQLERADEDSIEFSGVRLLEQPQVTRLIAIPSKIGTQEANWSTSTLQTLVVSTRWLKARNIPVNFQVYQDTRPFVCRMINRNSKTGTPEVVLQDSQLTLDEQLNYLMTSEYHTLPHGSKQINFQIPQSMQVLDLTCENQPISTKRTSANQVSVPFQSDQLTQTIKIVVKGRLESLDQLPEILALEPQALRSQTSWQIQIPKGFQLTSGQKVDPDMFYSSQLELLAKNSTTSNGRTSTISDSEITHWQKVRSRFMINNLTRWHIDSPMDLEAIITQADSLLANYEDHEFVLKQLSASQRSSEIEELAQNTYYLQSSKETELPFSISIREATPHYTTSYVLFYIGMSLLVGLCVWFAKQEEHKQEVVEWFSRVPHLFGLALGIVWWLFLLPSFLGLLIIGIFVLAAVPPIQLFKNRSVRTRPYQTKRV